MNRTTTMAQTRNETQKETTMPLTNTQTTIRKTIPTLCTLIAVAMLMSACLGGQALARDIKTTAKRPSERPLIQLAILLDTSNSMDGLIAQAKSQLWTVVNELATTERKGQRPRLEVALYEYGNSRLSRSSGYIRQVSGLTTDLDRISEQLFGLKTKGGDEYCGKVIDVATNELDWSRDRDNRALKMIYIAGNEAFTQGPTSYKTAMKTAIRQGIVVNTIHCGSEHDGIAGKWKDAARLADGSYLIINQNQQVAQIQAPQDRKLEELNAKLNETYVGYGDQGGEAKARQEEQDKTAAKLGVNTAATRAAFKATESYDAADWDIVSAAESGAVDLESVEDEALPAPMRAMSPKEKKVYVSKKAAERKSIQAEIQTLSKARDAHVLATAPAAASGVGTLGGAMVDSLRTQASKAGFNKVK